MIKELVETDSYNSDANNNYDMTIDDQYLTFTIQDEDYGIPIQNIKEIISICEITKVPHSPAYIKGIVNLRGDIVVVIDIRTRFSKPEKEYDDSTCIIVIEYNNYSLGLIVDNVNEVMFINENNISLPPKAKLNYPNQFISSIGRVADEIKLILDLEKLLYDKYD